VIGGVLPDYALVGICTVGSDNAVLFARELGCLEAREHQVLLVKGVNLAAQALKEPTSPKGGAGRWVIQ